MTIKRDLLQHRFGSHQGLILYVLEQHYYKQKLTDDIPVEWRSMEWFRQLSKHGTGRARRWNTKLLRRHLNELCQKGLLRRRVGRHGSPTAFWLNRERLKAELGLNTRLKKTLASLSAPTLERSAR